MLHDNAGGGNSSSMSKMPISERSINLEPPSIVADDSSASIDASTTIAGNSPTVEISSGGDNAPATEYELTKSPLDPSKGEYLGGSPTSAVALVVVFAACSASRDAANLCSFVRC